MIPTQALTIRNALGGPLRVLDCAVNVTTPSAAVGVPVQRLPFRAIWDTGASVSVITQNVIAGLSLAPTGKTNVETANGPRLSDVFLVDIELPNGVRMQSVTATEGIIRGFDVLIGMDIITVGDFSITNVGGETVMSFRTPSVKEVDWVKEIEEQNRLRTTTREGRRAAQKAAIKQQKRSRRP